MTLKDKKVLVTGAGGMIGHSLVKRALSEGAFVRATKYTRDIKVTHENLEVVPCELFNIKECEEVVKDIDVVFNSAAFVAGAGKQKEDPISLVRNNLIPSINISDAAVRNKVKVFVSIGSSTMYPDVNYPVKEDEAFSGEPFKGYEGVGWVKRFCEKAFRYYNNVTTTKFAFVRTTAVYGPHDNFDTDKLHVIPATIMKAVAKENPFIVWGDGTAIRDFVYVDDFVDGIMEVINREIWNDPINIATGTETTIKQMVETIINLCGYHPQVVYDSTKPTAIPYRMVDINKAKKMIDWSPKTTLVNGLYKTINWYKNEKHI